MVRCLKLLEKFSSPEKEVDFWMVGGDLKNPFIDFKNENLKILGLPDLGGSPKW